MLLVKLIVLFASIFIIGNQLFTAPVSALITVNNNKWISSTQVAFCSPKSSSILRSKIHDNISKGNSRSLKLYVSDSSKATDSSSSVSQSQSDPYLKHACKSCSFVYDEEKGFKKRYPPGKLGYFAYLFTPSSMILQIYVLLFGI